MQAASIAANPIALPSAAQSGGAQAMPSGAMSTFAKMMADKVGPEQQRVTPAGENPALIGRASASASSSTLPPPHQQRELNGTETDPSSADKNTAPMEGNPPPQSSDATPQPPELKSSANDLDARGTPDGDGATAPSCASAASNAIGMPAAPDQNDVSSAASIPTTSARGGAAFGRKGATAKGPTAALPSSDKKSDDIRTIVGNALGASLSPIVMAACVPATLPSQWDGSATSDGKASEDSVPQATSQPALPSAEPGDPEATALRAVPENLADPVPPATIVPESVVTQGIGRDPSTQGEEEKTARLSNETDSKHPASVELPIPWAIPNTASTSSIDPTVTAVPTPVVTLGTTQTAAKHLPQDKDLPASTNPRPLPLELKAQTSAGISEKKSPTPAEKTATAQQQDASLGDILRQVAAISGKANGEAVRASAKAANDPSTTAGKTTAPVLANATQSDPLDAPDRGAVVNAPDISVPGTEPRKGGREGAGNKPQNQDASSASASATSDSDKNYGAQGATFPQTTHAAVSTPDVATGNANDAAPIVLNAGATPEHAAAKTTAPDAPRSDPTTNVPRDVDYPERAESRGISSAQITSSGAQSEVHIAIQTDRLGAVELHARVTGEQVGAAIVVEKKEAHAALAVELPALQQALADKQLHVEHLWLTQGALDSSTGNNGHAANERQQRQSQTAHVAGQMGPDLPAIQGDNREMDKVFDERGRLSVLA